VRAALAHPVSPVLFSLHGAVRGGGRAVLPVWRSGLSRVPAQRLARDPGLGDGPPQRPPERRLRPGGGDGLGLRHGHRAGGHAQVRHRRHPALLRERPALPRPVRRGPGRGMKVSLRWLREFVDIDRPPAEIAHLLINAGIEVASVAPAVDGLSGAVVAQIEAVERDLETTRPGHLNRLCRVAAGGRRYSVIGGAPHVRPGLRTALAPPGARLPGGRAIDTAVIRGTVSEGMLCSERELGLGEDGAGIIELPADAPLGADLLAYLGLDDIIFEIEITPNRPDVLSVRGVARELAVLT